MAADLAIDASVSRTMLWLGPLEITPANGYNFSRNGIGPGDSQWRRTTVSTPYIKGRTLTHAVKDVQNVPVKMTVEGANTAQLTARIQTLIEAFSQFQYTLSFTLDSITYNWICEPADINVGNSGAWDDLMIRSHMQPVSMTIPRKPD